MPNCYLENAPPWLRIINICWMLGSLPRVFFLTCVLHLNIYNSPIKEIVSFTDGKIRAYRGWHTTRQCWDGVGPRCPDLSPYYIPYVVFKASVFYSCFLSSLTSALQWKDLLLELKGIFSLIVLAHNIYTGLIKILIT